MSFEVGVVGRPHGLDGSFYVVSARSELLTEGMQLEGLGAIVAVKGTGEHPIIRVAGIEDREAAEAVRGRDLLVDESLRPPLDDDEYLAADLEGCHVADGAQSLGDVVRLLALPSCEVLELDTGILVPLVSDAIRAIDVEAKKIEVDARFLGAA